MLQRWSKYITRDVCQDTFRKLLKLRIRIGSREQLKCAKIKIFRTRRASPASVAGQNLDQRASRLLSRLTLANRIRQHSLHRLQIGDLGTDIRHMGGCEVPRLGAGIVALGAGKPHEGPNVIKREAELPRSPDKTHPCNVVGIVAPKPAAWPVRQRQQANPLVIADRLDVALGSPR